MDREELFSRVKKIISEKISPDIKGEILEESFFDELGMDSLDFVATIIQVETEFGITINDYDINGTSISTISKLLDLITLKLSTK